MAKENINQAPVEESISKTEAFVLKYKKIIAAAVAAIIIVVAGGILINQFYLTPRQDEASTALAKSQEYFAMQQYDKALNGDKAGSIGLLKIIDEYGCTDAANLAQLYAGLCYAGLEKWQDAANYLEDFNTKDDAMVSPAALEALGNSYAHLNRLDDAVSTLKKAAAKADGQAENGVNVSLSPLFLMQAAQILENQGKTADALEIYENVKKNYVNSLASRDIDKYIERCTK